MKVYTGESIHSCVNFMPAETCRPAFIWLRSHPTIQLEMFSDDGREIYSKHLFRSYIKSSSSFVLLWLNFYWLVFLININKCPKHSSHALTSLLAAGIWKTMNLDSCYRPPSWAAFWASEGKWYYVLYPTIFVLGLQTEYNTLHYSDKPKLFFQQQTPFITLLEAHDEEKKMIQTLNTCPSSQHFFPETTGAYLYDRKV